MKGRGIFENITKNVFIMGIVSLFTDLSSQMVFPLIPLYMSSVLGAGAIAIGLVEGVAQSSASLLKVFSGYFSDKMNKRKNFVFAGYFLSTISKPLFAFASIWQEVFVIRIIERVGKGIRTAPRDALIAESADKKHLANAYGFHRSMDGVGSIMGAGIAFVLLPIIGYKNIFLLSFVPAMIAVISIFFIKERLKKREEKREHSVRYDFSQLPKNLKRFIFISALFAFAQFGYAFLLLKSKYAGNEDIVSIFFYILLYLTYTILVMPLSSLSDKIGRKPMMIAGYAMFVLTALGIIFISGKMFVPIFFITYAIFFAMTDGVQRAFVAELAPKNLKATALGAFHSAIGIVALPGGFVFGLLWEGISPQASFTFSAIVGTIAMLMLFGIKTKRD